VPISKLLNFSCVAANIEFTAIGFCLFDHQVRLPMPNTVAAKKYLRQSAKRRLLNRSQRSALRTALKKARAAASGDDAAAAQEAVRAATQRLDQAASKNIIHKNAASRTKARLAKLMKSKFEAK
jgi:small subunit ribosomal protein S20